MSSHSTTKLQFNMIFQNQMRSKIRPTSKHVSYSIVCVWYRPSCCSNNTQHRGSPFGATKYLCTILASALAACRRVCVLCTPDLTSHHNTAAPRQDECQQES